MGTMPTSAGRLRSASLLRDYAWSSRTTETRGSEWKAWVDFFDEEDGTILPFTEAHLVAFIGWIAGKREDGERSVSCSSFPQYLRAVRQIQLHALGYVVPDFPLVTDVVPAYTSWE